MHKIEGTKTAYCDVSKVYDCVGYSVDTLQQNMPGPNKSLKKLTPGPIQGDYPKPITPTKAKDDDPKRISTQGPDSDHKKKALPQEPSTLVPKLVKASEKTAQEKAFSHTPIFGDKPSPRAQFSNKANFAPKRPQFTPKPPPPPPAQKDLPKQDAPNQKQPSPGQQPSPPSQPHAPPSNPLSSQNSKNSMMNLSIQNCVVNIQWNETNKNEQQENSHINISNVEMKNNWQAQDSDKTKTSPSALTIERNTDAADAQRQNESFSAENSAKNFVVNPPEPLNQQDMMKIENDASIDTTLPKEVSIVQEESKFSLEEQKYQ